MHPLFQIAGLVAGFVATITIYFLFGLWPAAATAAIFLVPLLVTANRSTQARSAAATNDESEGLAPNKLEQALESLLTVNLDIRLQVMPAEVRANFEKIIDHLLIVLPKVEYSAPDGELAWVVYRIAEDYLPKRLVQPYLSMATDTRAQAATITDVLANLEAMQSELTDVDRMISARTVDEYSAKSTFIRKRFNIQK